MKNKSLLIPLCGECDLIFQHAYALELHLQHERHIRATICHIRASFGEQV